VLAPTVMPFGGLHIPEPIGDLLHLRKCDVQYVVTFHLGRHCDRKLRSVPDYRHADARCCGLVHQVAVDVTVRFPPWPIHP